MEKLIITVTCDSRMSYPANENCPQVTDTKGVAAEYNRSVDAGAVIAHMHGSYSSDPEIMPDGRKLQIPMLDKTVEIADSIRSHGNPIIQMGLASMRFEQKLELWKLINADMNSTAFNAHDEYFQPDRSFPANEVYAVHPVSELTQYCQAANEHGVKLEIESFHQGAFWNIQKIRETPGLLPDPVWTTLFLGWPGGSCTPPDGPVIAVPARQPAAALQLEHELHVSPGILAPSGHHHPHGRECAGGDGGLPLPRRRLPGHNQRPTGREGGATGPGNRTENRLPRRSPQDHRPFVTVKSYASTKAILTRLLLKSNVVATAFLL